MFAFFWTQNSHARTRTRFRRVMFHGVGWLARPSGNLRQLPRRGRSSRTSWALKAMRLRPMRPTHRIEESIDFRSFDESRIRDLGKETFDVFQWCILRGNGQQTLYTEDSTKWHEVYAPFTSFHPFRRRILQDSKFQKTANAVHVWSSQKSDETSKHLVTWARHKILDSEDLSFSQGEQRKEPGPMLSHGGRTCWHLTSHQTQQHESFGWHGVTPPFLPIYSGSIKATSHITSPDRPCRLMETVGKSVKVQVELKPFWGLCAVPGKNELPKRQSGPWKFPKKCQDLSRS